MFGQCLTQITTQYGLAGSLFLAGLFGGFTHCVGMCAPFVLAQTHDGPSIRKIGSGLLLPYHLGRLTTYTLMAVALNATLGLAFIYSPLRLLVTVPMLLAAAVFFLVAAFPQMAAMFPWSARVPLQSLLGKVSALGQRFVKRQDVPGRYMLGVILGFMPCGMVTGALLAAAAAPTPLAAGAGMAAFAAGTMPALMILGLGGRGLQVRFPIAMARITRGAMALSSLLLFILAGMMIF
ncbi:MAG: sulfite exporter TauE/SafE family protein [Rhodospirillales bacterium]|nr:sulfite exporter TauE/SafE family protein [Alphaproteobacteria bacterium]MCB9987283.1 sulfite exporter TauE/SafE family protein [Rhodospirillales bacterium]USO07860.1 MAG: sulfite exporter TauE/SafE family protein [Rhodospirillales bacterium]